MHTDIATIAARRNDDLLAFADAIVAATNAGVSIDTIREAANSAVKPARKARKSAPTMPVRNAQSWKTDPSSASQRQYIPALAARKGIHTMQNTKTGEMIPMTAEGIATISKGYASKLYYSLKAMPNLTVKSRHADAITWDSDGTDDSGYAEGDDTSRWIERIESRMA